MNMQDLLTKNGRILSLSFQTPRDIYLDRAVILIPIPCTTPNKKRNTNFIECSFVIYLMCLSGAKLLGPHTIALRMEV